MTTIKTKLFSHKSTSPRYKHLNAVIRKMSPKKVSRYSQLLAEVAKVNYYNPGFAVFYRGQDQDHTIKIGKKHVTSIYPSIYRNDGRLRKAEIEERFEKLDVATRKLIESYIRNKYPGSDRMKKYPELAWSVIQHYMITETPLLDITHSLLVATSFALLGSKQGILYVIGLPNVTNGISFSIEEELLNIKLLSICPPTAKRPYYQEGYLVGTFPMRVMRKHQHLDCAKRLFAKYQIDNSDDGFWDNNIQQLPQQALFPEDDRMIEIANAIKSEVGEKPLNKSLKPTP